MIPLALYFLFFLSGAGTLAFQIAWTRLFSAGLGHEVPAVLAVVAAIFGGMAAGAWAGDRATRSRPGHWYGWCELLIGSWGLLCIGLIPYANRAALTLTGLHPSPLRQWLVAFAIPGLVLLPATAAMGATFPAMARFLGPRVTGGRCLGALYAANTLGAVSGIVASTSIVLPSLGFARGLALFSSLSLLCGSIALRLAANEPRPSRTRACPRIINFLDFVGHFVAHFTEFRPVSTQCATKRLLLTLAVTGLLGIGFEVLVVRVLAGVLENTVYSFAAVLSVYLLGTAIGAALYQRRARSRSTASFLLALATSVLLAAWTLSHAPALAEWTRHVLGDTPLGVWAAEFVTAGAVVLLPTLLMGAAFSHLLERAQAQGISLGRALALNTMGSALAPLLFGVLLLPWIGSKWALIALGWAYLPLAWPLARRQRWLVALPLLLPLELPWHGTMLVPPTGGTILAAREGVMDSVAVLEHPDLNRSLLVNGRFSMGGTGAALAERRHASIPLLLHPQPQRALFLGLGTGITFGAASAHPGLVADGVELVPEIVDLLPWFAPQNGWPLDPARFLVTVGDARRFVQVCPHPYDVIVADLFHPARDGAGALYSREHFQALRQRLAPGGLFCQWLPLFQLNDTMLRVIMRTFLDVFPDTRAFLLRPNVDTPVLGLFSGLPTDRFGPDYFAHRVRDLELQERLNAEGLRDSFQLLGGFVAGPDALRRFAADAPRNTDDQPTVLFGAPQFNLDGRATPYGRLTRLLSEIGRPDLRDLLSTNSPAGAQFAADLAAFILARNRYLQGLIADTEGHSAEATAAYLQSARLSHYFSTAYAQCLTLAMQQAKTDPAAARQLLQGLVDARPERPVAARLLERLKP